MSIIKRGVLRLENALSLLYYALFHFAYFRHDIYSGIVGDRHDTAARCRYYVAAERYDIDASLLLG